jgi:hypothetical protein
MKRKIVFILLLLAIIALIFSFNIKKQFTVIKAEKGDYTYYPPDCFLNYKSEKFLKREEFIYSYMILVEYHVPAGESMLDYKFDLIDNHYLSDVDGYKILNFKKENDEVIYNSKRYKIEKIIGDSIFSKSESGYLVFIDKK